MSKIIATNNPNVVQVEGSFIQVIAQTKQARLKVRFQGGREYLYMTDVPNLVAETFKAISSHDGAGFSSWFSRNVKDNADFDYKEIEK